jgi:hypothetical protein
MGEAAGAVATAVDAGAVAMVGAAGVAARISLTIAAISPRFGAAVRVATA